MPKRKPKPYEEINPRLHGTDSGWQAGCDCEDCKKAHSVRAQIHNRAKLLAAQWVKKNRPVVWDDCINQAYIYFDQERGEIGRSPEDDRRGFYSDYNR